MPYPSSLDRPVSPPEALDTETLGMAVQLVRANNLTMSRFQLALHRGDRRLAMMALDGLLDIDAEMALFVEGLVPDNKPPMQAITAYLIDQKEAIATEKHGLAGHVGIAEKAAPMPADDDNNTDRDVSDRHGLASQLPALDTRMVLIAAILIIVTMVLTALAIR